MINQNNDLLIELWLRIKSHIPNKERLEVADLMVMVFDEFDMITDTILDEELDKELRAASKSLFADSLDPEEEEDGDFGE